MADLTVTTPYKRSGGRTIVRSSTDPATFLIPFTFVPPSSYTGSGGDTIATADMPSGYTTLITPWAVAGGPYGFKLDVANKKLLVYGAASTATAVQLANGTNVQTVMGTAAITIFFVCN